MLCPNCKTKLLRLPAKDLEGNTKDVWIHPETIKKCDYKNDGIRVTTEIIDHNLSKAFNDLIEAEGLKDEIVSKSDLPLNSENPLKAESNEEILKERLVDGKISISEYKEILEIVNKEIKE